MTTKRADNNNNNNNKQSHLRNSNHNNSNNNNNGYIQHSSTRIDRAANKNNNNNNCPAQFSWPSLFLNLIRLSMYVGSTSGSWLGAAIFPKTDDLIVNTKSLFT